MTKIYIGMSADLLHPGHLNIIEEARKIINNEQNGEIIIGTDHWEYFDWILEQIKGTNLTAIIPNMDIIQTRYQHKNKAGTESPKYLILKN